MGIGYFGLLESWNFYWEAAMRRVVNGCVNCDLPCIGKVCPNRYELEYYCDDCGDSDTLYYFGDEELCLDCIVKRLKVVEGTEWF